jgi:hypothetical protein
VQVQPHHGFNHIYCPKSFITIDDRTEFCPEDVFVLPITVSFKINNVAYTGSQVQLDHVAMIDPLFTMRANGHFQPRINLSDLMQDPLVVANKSIADGEEAALINHPMTWSTIECLTIIITMVISGAVLYYRKGIKITVTATPAEGSDQAESE